MMPWIVLTIISLIYALLRFIDDLVEGILDPLLSLSFGSTGFGHLTNIARVQNCPDITILNSLFVFLSFCIFVFLS